MNRCQRLIHCRQPLARYSTTHAKSQQLLQPVAADMIGTPDPVTNLRPVRYYVPPDETQEVWYPWIHVVTVNHINDMSRRKNGDYNNNESMNTIKAFGGITIPCLLKQRQNMKRNVRIIYCMKGLNK